MDQRTWIHQQAKKPAMRPTYCPTGWYLCKWNRGEIKSRVRGTGANLVQIFLKERRNEDPDLWGLTGVSKVVHASMEIEGELEERIKRCWKPNVQLKLEHWLYSTLPQKTIKLLITRNKCTRHSWNSASWKKWAELKKSDNNVLSRNGSGGWATSWRNPDN